MSTAPHDLPVAARADAGATADLPPGGLRGWLGDVAVLGRRNLQRIFRSPDLVFYALLQPLMFILLFVYVFGGAIQVPGTDYTQFLLPGIFVQMVIFGSVGATAIGVAEDMERGIMDRFRSLPMTSSSVLLGRQITEIVRNVAAIVVMIVAGLLVGFRFQGDLPAVLGAFGLLLLFGFAFSWLAAVIGLTAGSAEAAQGAGLLWLFPFTFLSSAFVPTETMPGWLRVYTDHSPVTVVVDTLRAWFTGQAAGPAAWQSLAWSVGVTAVFMPLAMYLFRKDQP